MGVLLTIFLVIFALVILWHFLTRKYLNPYKLYVIFGPKGVGKSTLLQKLVHYYKKQGLHVYCNIGDCDDPNVIQFPIDYLPQLAEAGQQIYHYKNVEPAKKLEEEFKEKGITSPPYIKLGSVIFLDEINLKFDNRAYKQFSPEMQRYFRLQRHYKHIFIGFSQTYDCDKKIRDLADYLLILDKFARVWIHSKAYCKKPIIVRPDNVNSRETANMTDDFIPMGFIYNMTSPFKAWLPYWCKKHDSFK